MEINKQTNILRGVSKVVLKHNKLKTYYMRNRFLITIPLENQFHPRESWMGLTDQQALQTTKKKKTLFSQSEEQV